MYVNGYEIPDHNYGTGAGREYHLCNAAGEVVKVIKTSKQLAIVCAKGLPLGDVPEPKPEPVPDAAKPKMVTRKKAN